MGYRYDDTGIKKAEADVGTYKSGVVGLIAVTAAAVAAFAHTITSAIDFGNELSLTSQKLGINVEQLQEFQYAAGTVGISADKFSLSLGILSKNLLQAQAGSKGAIKAFKELNINPKGFKDSSDLIFKIADKFAALPDSYKKAGIAKELFGRGGLGFIPFLDLGSEKIRSLGQTAKDLNAVMGTDTVKAAREAHDSLFELGFLLKALERGIGATFIPAINKITQGMIKWFEANSKMIGSGIKAFFEGVGAAATVVLVVFESLAKAIELLLKPFGGLEKFMKYLTGPFGFLLVARLITGLLPWLGSLAASILGVDAAAAPWLTGLLLIIAALAALAIAIQDVVYFMQGRKSLLGDILGDEDSKKLREYTKNLREVYEIMKKIADLTTGGIASFIFKGQGGAKRVAATELIPESERDYSAASNYQPHSPATIGSAAEKSGAPSISVHVPVNVSGGWQSDWGNKLDQLSEGLKNAISEFLHEEGYVTQRNLLPIQK